MKNWKRIVGVISVTLFCFGIVGCEKEGGAEKAGKQLDNALDSVKKKADDLMK